MFCNKKLIILKNRKILDEFVFNNLTKLKITEKLLSCFEIEFLITNNSYSQHAPYCKPYLHNDN